MKTHRAMLRMSLVVMAAFGGSALGASKGGHADLKPGDFFTIADYMGWLPSSKETTHIKDTVASTKVLERLEHVGPTPNGMKSALYEYRSSSGISVTSRIYQASREADAEPLCKGKIGAASAALAEEDLTTRVLPTQGLADTMLIGVYQRDGEPVGNMICSRRAGHVVWIDFYGPGFLANAADLKKRLGGKISGMLDVELAQ